MVRGLDIFKTYFDAYSHNYVIIGGTACDIIIDEAGFSPCATKDIDIVLVEEALSSEFVKQFWQFVFDGNYERMEKSEEDRKYYRFINPENSDFPYQLELFSRNPDLMDLNEGTHLTPIPVEDDLSSLSAILLEDDFYIYMIAHSKLEDGLHLANIEALICLKARAYIDIAERIAQGSKEDSKKLRKHKGDVFRLAVMLTEDDMFELPENIKIQMQYFVDTIVGELPDKAIFKAMGLGNIDPKIVFTQILKSFQLDGK
jgi:hypothetical protein